MKPAARTPPPAAMFSRRCVLDDRGLRIAPVRWSRWWPVPGRMALRPEVRRAAKRNVSAAIALDYNGWQRLILMTIGSALANACVLLPLLWASRHTLLPFILNGMAPAGPPGSAALPGLGPIIMWMISFALVVWVVSMLATLPFMRWYWCPVIVNAVVNENHCGSCGYPLFTAMPAPDGCTICPECGAAWKLLPLIPPAAHAPRL